MIDVIDWGYTNPVVSDLYGRPPLVWRDMDIQLVVYETDMENIEKVLPAPLKPRTNKVIVWQSEFKLGTHRGDLPKPLFMYRQNIKASSGLRAFPIRRQSPAAYGGQGNLGISKEDGMYGLGI